MRRRPLGSPSQPAGPRRPPRHILNVGSFRFWFVGQRWEWSDEVARMHGYQPGSVVPTTELLMSHKHPDDRAHVQDLLDYALRSEESFSSRHRFVDTAGNVHDAIVVADRMLDESGRGVGHRRLLHRPHRYLRRDSTGGCSTRPCPTYSRIARRSSRPRAC